MVISINSANFFSSSSVIVLPFTIEEGATLATLSAIYFFSSAVSIASTIPAALTSFNSSVSGFSSPFNSSVNSSSAFTSVGALMTDPTNPAPAVAVTGAKVSHFHVDSVN